MMQMAVTIKVSSSAKRIDAQIPSIAKKTGRIKTALIWNTSVRKKEISADKRPLFNAVKNEES